MSPPVAEGRKAEITLEISERTGINDEGGQGSIEGGAGARGGTEAVAKGW